MQGIFTREDANNQRRTDMFRLAAHLFGVRGLESRQDYLYLDSGGMLHDARQEPETYQAISRMHDLAREGLLSESFINGSDMTSAQMLEDDLGFMQYDYNQTQTVYNRTKLQADEGEKYMAVLLPVARWKDGTDGGRYMRFTESWRSVKATGWAVSRAGVEGDPDKLCAALALIDYAYSDAGVILMSYGPDAFIKTRANGGYATFPFNGKAMPEIADAAYAELWEKADGNYTNYARRYLGSTLGFIKSQAFEYQCTTEAGREGAGNISAAIAFGVIKHPRLAITENLWYTLIPTVLPVTAQEADLLSIHEELDRSFSLSKGGSNRFVDEIIHGCGVPGVDTAGRLAAEARDAMGGSEYLRIKQSAWDRVRADYR